MCADDTIVGGCWPGRLDWGRRQTIRFNLFEAEFTRTYQGRNLYCRLLSPARATLEIGWVNGNWGVCSVSDEVNPVWSIYYEEFQGGGQWNFAGFQNLEATHFGADVAHNIGFDVFDGPMDFQADPRTQPDVKSGGWPITGGWPARVWGILENFSFYPSGSMAIKAGASVVPLNFYSPGLGERQLVTPTPPTFRTVYRCSGTFDNSQRREFPDGDLRNYMGMNVGYVDPFTDQWRNPNPFGPPPNDAAISTRPLNTGSQDGTSGETTGTISRSGTHLERRYTSTHQRVNTFNGSTTLDCDATYQFRLELIDHEPCGSQARQPLPPGFDENGQPEKPPGTCPGCGD